MNGAIVAHKRFIESVYEGGVDGVFFHATAEILPLEKGDVKHPTCWDGTFNIRMGPTLLMIHNHDADYQLEDFETKLKLIRTQIEDFTRLCLRRLRKRGDTVAIKRMWLNPDHLDTAFTGHCFYRVSESGNGQFYLSDCHKSVHLYLDVYDDELDEFKGKAHSYRTTLKCLRDLYRALRVAIKKIRQLRAEIQNKQNNLKPILPVQ